MTVTPFDQYFRSVSKEKNRLEKSLEKVTLENGERLELIGQLEKVGSSLRNDLMDTREGLASLASELEQEKRESQSLRDQVSNIDMDLILKQL